MTPVLLACLALAAAAVPASAQQPTQQLQQQLAGLRLSLAKNKAVLSQYTWTERTEVLIKGKVKKTEDRTCRYDSEGNVVKTLVSTPEADKVVPGLGVARKLAANEKEEMTDYTERAVTLVHRYVPPDPERLHQVVGEGTASAGQAGPNQAEFRFTNYYNLTDALVLTYDPATNRAVKLSVKSDMGDPKDKVTLEVLFRQLPDGATHPSTAILNAPNKKVQVKVSNTNYQKLP